MYPKPDLQNACGRRCGTYVDVFCHPLVDVSGVVTVEPMRLVDLGVNRSGGFVGWMGLYPVLGVMTLNCVLGPWCLTLRLTLVVDVR